MIKTFTGPMHSGKTAAMMKEYFSIWNKEHILCFKPKEDTRDGASIKSKDYEESIDAIVIDDLDELLEYVTDDIKKVFIDEAEMLTGDVRVLLYFSLIKDVDIYLAGLNMTSELEPFLIMPQILAVSDEVHYIKASCYDCGRKAGYTFYDGEKTETIVPGDENYLSLCNKCLVKRMKSKQIDLLQK